MTTHREMFIEVKGERRRSKIFSKDFFFFSIYYLENLFLTNMNGIRLGFTSTLGDFIEDGKDLILRVFFVEIP